MKVWVAIRAFEDYDRPDYEFEVFESREACQKWLDCIPDHEHHPRSWEFEGPKEVEVRS